MRQDLESHVLERDRRAMEEFEEVSAVRIMQRDDLLHIEIVPVSTLNASLQLFFRKIGEQQLHHFIGDTAIIHPCQLRKGFIKCRNLCRDKQTAVLGQAHQNRF